MNSKLFREYQFKFYLNAGHSISFDGEKGDTHPHTWEFLIVILIRRENLKEYNIYEKAIEQYFAKYQNSVLNDVEPFDAVMPTLENIVDCFGDNIREIIRRMDGILCRIEGSETPTRRYNITYEKDEEYLAEIERSSVKSVSEILDRILDSMLEEGVLHDEDIADNFNNTAVPADGRGGHGIGIS